MTEKQITQQVKLSPAAHCLIADAQKQLGLAHFPVALGYVIEGMVATLADEGKNRPAFIVKYMRLGRDRLEK